MAVGSKPAGELTILLKEITRVPLFISSPKETILGRTVSAL